MHALTAKNPSNFAFHDIIEISLVLHSYYVISKNQKEFIFWIKNYIYLYEFNQLNDLA